MRSSLPRRPVAALAATALSLPLLAGCGGGGGNKNADPATVAPAGTVLYVTATVRPEGSQKSAVESIARKLFRVQDPGARIARLVERGSNGKLTFNDDIKPWLGKRAAFAFTRLSGGSQTSGALIVSSKDNDKARKAIDKDVGSSAPKRTYRGVSYKLDGSTAEGVVGNFAVAGDEPVFKQVVDASKDSGKRLSGKSQYRAAAGGASGKLGFGYLDLEGLLGSLSASGSLPPGSGTALQSVIGANPKPVVLSLDATSDSVTAELTAKTSSSRSATGQQTPLVTGLPGDAWFALGLSHVGQTVKHFVDTLSTGLGGSVIDSAKQQIRARTGLDIDRDLLPAIGDVAFFARGTSPLTVGGGAVIQTPQRTAARRLVSKLPRLLRLLGARGLRIGRASVAGATGIQVRAARLPGAINVVTRGDRLVIAYGNPATEAALRPHSRLGQASDFQRATQSLGGLPPLLFVSFQPIAQLVRSSANSNSSAAQVASYLQALSTLAAGVKTEGGKLTGRLVLKLK